MTFIPTLGISASAAGLTPQITTDPMGTVYPFAERCDECLCFRAIDGYRYTCGSCI